MNKTLIATAVFLVFFFGLFIFVQQQKQHHDQTGNKPPVKDTSFHEQTNPPQKPLPPEPAKHEEYTATISAVGDILIHDRVYDKAANPDGTYHFSPMFRQVKDELTSSDITIANQETMIGGVKHGLSSYPSFNSPAEVGDALKENGVDLVTIANNHTLDRGEKVILSAIEHWNTIGMAYTGAFRSPEDKTDLRLIRKNNITFSFLSYTYGTNGIPVPEGKDHLVNLIQPELVKREVSEAKKLSDAVVVSLHFGNEYERLPNPEQEALAKLAADAGADVIIGHHPHVLQPVKWISRKDGSKAFVAYSLGNFLSGQRGDYKDLGGIIHVSVSKKMDGKRKTVMVHSPRFTPTYVDSQYVIWPLSELPEKKEVFEEIKQHMNRYMQELSFD
ncbi:CapA family protein [Fictibacillus iocasae]|uniref:CapA family protein n=1 Tax=Fictibacillus iocasae TaxID=2715437 RepID=A0ABW2NTN9_9BACL